MEYFLKYPETGVTRPDQIAVVGDRLTTDVMMANLMGGYAVWVRDGVVSGAENGLVSAILDFDRQELIGYTNGLTVCEVGEEPCGFPAE